MALPRAHERLGPAASVSTQIHMISDLAALVSPAPVALFLDHFVNKSRLHVQTADTARTASLLPWAAINQLIESGALPADRLQIVRANNAVDPRLYRKGGNAAVQAGVLQDLLRQGATAVISYIDEVVPPIGRLTAALERELGCEAWCNAYLGFGEGLGFRPHYDLHDVVVVQVHGRKRWRSFGTPVPYPIGLPAGSATIDQQKPVWEAMVEAGDVLYLPRGEAHMALLHDQPSVHLSIGLLSRRGLDFADAIVRRAARDSLFRQDIPVTAGETAMAAYEAALKTALHALIDQADLSGYLGRENRARPLRPFVNLGIAAPFAADLTVAPALRRRIPLDIDKEGEVEITVGGEKFRLSAPARRVLDLLLRQGELNVGTIVSALAGQLPEPLVRDAVATLARQGLVGLGS